MSRLRCLFFIVPFALGLTTGQLASSQESATFPRQARRELPALERQDGRPNPFRNDRQSRGRQLEQPPASQRFLQSQAPIAPVPRVARTEHDVLPPKTTAVPPPTIAPSQTAAPPQTIAQPASANAPPTAIPTDAAAAPVPETPSSRPTNENVEQRLEEVGANQELDEPTKTELLKRYKASQEWLKIAAESNRKAAAFQADIENAPRVLAEAKRLLAESTATPTINVPPAATLAEIEQLASAAEANFKAAQETLAKKEDELQRRSTRKSEISKLEGETKQRLEEAQKQLQMPAVPDEAPLLLSARRTETHSRSLALESQLALYKVELARHDALSEAIPLARDIAKREKNTLEGQLQQWQTEVTSQRKRESARQAAEARLQAQNAHPALRSLAERNAALAEQRKSLVDSIAQVGRQFQDVEKVVEKLQEQFKKAEERVRKAGHSTTVGLMLRRQKEGLPSARECNQTLREIQAEMPKANLAQIEVEEEREALGDIEAVVPQVLARLAVEGTGNDAVHLEQTARDLIVTKLELLGSLATDYDTYLEDLSDLEASNGKLADQIEESSNYIGEHVLWIRSADSLGMDDVATAARGALAVAAPESWIEVAKHCGLDTIQRPLPAMCVLVIVALIVFFHAKLRAKMVTVCSTKTGGATLRFRPTLEAIGLAAVVATEWPLLLAYLGWRMSTAEATESLTVALGISLLYAAVLLWVSDFVKHILRRDGLAESHLGWSAFSAKLFRSELRWLTLLGIPIAVVAVGLQHFQNGEWSDSLGRFAFVAYMLLLANFMHSILNSKENILREAISQDAGSWLARLRQVAHTVGVAVPCLLAILAVAGYYYSAQQVALRWLATIGVSLTLLFAYSVAARWCLVKRRNLAVLQARERQRQAAAGAAASDSVVAAPAIQIEDQQPDLSAIHEQLRYLLRHAAIVGMVVCSWFIWADVLPALKVLDHVVLWETVVEVTATHEGADGIIERTPEERRVTTTLRHLLFAGLLVVATVIIGRNLPALLEVTVLQRIPFDKGGRHAISVLLKYALALSGLFLACRTLSFTWSSVQWLAAGMTVGLGFGLQEIFANFVSGLILLFERPIRVGDVITLGDVTGTVTSMRIRATTVTNWDRKELIVPNKDLITGRLLNWTLTDTTNRIVIRVGVAYQSDPQRARELILKAVTEHQNVLADPAPNVTFEEFADSALNLVVRAYVASMDIRLATIHDLHIAIHAALREAGIEIAFPQRDIHVRGLEHMMMPKAQNETQKGTQGGMRDAA